MSQLPEACMKNRLSCLAKKFSLFVRCKACPKTSTSCKGFKLAFHTKESGVLDQDSSSYNLLCRHQWGITLLTMSSLPSIRHAWNSLCSGICPDQALQFCFHWSMNSHWPAESQFRCNTFTVIYMPDCCLLGAVDGRGQCGRLGSIREPFCGTQHGSLLGCTFWSQLLTFGPFQERGRERQETVYPCGSLIWMHDVQSILKLFWQSNCVCKPLASLGLV